MRPEDRREVQGGVPRLRPRFACIRQNARSPCRPTNRILRIHMLPVFAIPGRGGRRALSHLTKPCLGWGQGLHSCEERDFYRILPDRCWRPPVHTLHVMTYVVTSI